MSTESAVTLVLTLFFMAATFVFGWITGFLRGMRRGWLNEQRLYSSHRHSARCEVVALREQVRELRNQAQPLLHRIGCSRARNEE